MQKALVVSVAIAVDNVSLVCANQKLSLLQPAVTRVIVADVLLLLIEGLFGVASTGLVSLHRIKPVC